MNDGDGSVKPSFAEGDAGDAIEQHKMHNQSDKASKKPKGTNTDKFGRAPLFNVNSAQHNINIVAPNC